MSWRAGIHGYAARWDVTTLPLIRPNAPHLSRPARFRRGCFAYDPGDTEIWFMHRSAQKIGRGSELGLELWEDGQGLAFAFVPPPTAYTLVCGIADGRYSQCSVGAEIQESFVDHTDRGTTEIVGRACLREISICPMGACPGAICWHTGNGHHGLSPSARALLPAWHRGYAAHASHPIPNRR